MHFAQPLLIKLLVVTARYPSYRFRSEMDQPLRSRKIRACAPWIEQGTSRFWAKTPRQHFCNKLSGMECAHLAVL